ncbi:MAG: hypothetical protein ABW084_00860 [Candidatus Thiodiazotropha sp.]
MEKKGMTSAELQRNCIRTIALMNTLSKKVGAKSINNFSRIFDDTFSNLEIDECKDAVSTEYRNTWYPFFKGERPITDKQLKRLICIEDQVDLLYTEGPSKLWVAMWGDVSDLIEIIRDYNASLSQMPFHYITKQVPHLIRDIVDGGRVIGDLVWAISYYRYLKEMQPNVLVDVENYPVTQASCAWVLLESCMNDSFISSELDALGIRAQVTNELSAQEIERMRQIPFEQRLTDAELIPKFVVDLSMEEAEIWGAFVEDALSYEDASDSACDEVSFRQTMLFSC